MNVLYDRKSSLTWPNGKTMTADELKEHSVYKVLFQFDHVLSVNGDGVTYAYSRLAYLKDSFGITEEDPEKAFALVQEAQQAAKEAAAEESEKKASLLEQLQAENAELKVRVEIQDEAILELANLVSEMGA